MITVFLGPTLTRESAKRQFGNAMYHSPAVQGDIYRAASGGADAIGIVDGYFENAPSIWHKEILWALDHTIPVYGSASLGALRAAELASFGMIGVGAIFEAFRNGELEDDDEVALIHGDETSGFFPLSEPLVNIRATLKAAFELGLLREPVKELLLSLAKRTHYTERNYEGLISEAESCVSTEALAAFKQWYPNNAINQKAEDATEMLRLMRRDSMVGNSAILPTQFLQRTSWWLAFEAQESVAENAAEIE